MIYFYASQLLAAIVIPIIPPLHRTQVGQKLQEMREIAEAGEVRFVLTDDRLQAVYLGGLAGSSVQRVLTFSDLHGEDPLEQVEQGNPEDIAFIQYTSGSTGGRKGVPLRQRHLLANIDAIARGLNVLPEDCGVSFLPVYHDMGLIGKVLTVLCTGIRLVLMSPLDFIRRPAAWLEAIHRYSGTICAAPPFAYRLCTRRISEQDSTPLDLRSWRIAMIAADMIHPYIMSEFTDRFGAQGLSRDVFLPVYGLAESSLASTFPTLDDRLHTLSFKRPGHQATRVLVGVGHPVEGMDVAIQSSEGDLLSRGQEGEIVIRGTSVVEEYWRTEDSPMRAGWLRTGDLGVLTEQGLFVSGRIKDALKYHGRTLQPSGLEWTAQSVDGVRAGCCAAFNVSESNDAIVLVAESRLEPTAERERLAQQLHAVVQQEHGVRLHDVVIVSPRTIPKTTSGKVRRYLTRQQFEASMLERSMTTELVANLSAARSVARGKIMQVWQRLHGKSTGEQDHEQS